MGHEAGLRLFSKVDVAVNDRTHFFALAARVMRDLLVDHARARGAAEIDAILATLFMESGRDDEALRLYREALAERRQSLGNEHPGTAQSLFNLGVCLRSASALGEAETALREALPVLERVHGERSAWTMAGLDEPPEKGELASSRVEGGAGALARAYTTLGRLEEAERWRQRAAGTRDE